MGIYLLEKENARCRVLDTRWKSNWIGNDGIKHRNKVDKMEVIDSIIVKMWITMWIVWIKL